MRSYFFPHYIMSYVVATQIKALIKKHGMMASGDLSEGINALLEEAVSKAVGRAKENGRKTVRSGDL